FGKKPVIPPLRFLKLPPVAGESWRAKSTIGDTSTVVTFELRQESVTVPAGRFDTFASVANDIPISGQPVSGTYWFASGYGLVRLLLKAGNDETLLELVNFEPGK